MTKKSYKRVLLKLSGEMLGGEEGSGIETHAIEMIASEIAEVHRRGYELAIVIGGGNIFRGSQAAAFGMERASADYMGMLATCINGLALQAILETQHQIPTRVMTAIHMPELAEPYIRRKATKHLDSGRLVIFAGGTGNPLFTTDTAASLRAQEISAEIILKGTKVDGIYDKDPAIFDDAVKYQELSYLDVISRKLQVMDATAITMCMEAQLPVLVFQLEGGGSALKALEDFRRGTVVR
ncbi:MAG: UMP kinase [Deltaproteobacteria bacterium]|nr:UMP kinase [Deltaproteobacteria bacterium]